MRSFLTIIQENLSSDWHIQGSAYIIDKCDRISVVSVGDVIAPDAIVNAETSEIRFKAKTLMAVYFLRQVGIMFPSLQLWIQF